MTDHGAAQIKEACRLTGARWGVWLAHDGREWVFSANWGLARARQAALQRLLTEGETSAWLAGALASGRTRWRDAQANADALRCQRIFAFPNVSAHRLLLVGADELQKTAEGLFHVIALTPQAMPLAAAPLPAALSPALTLQDVEREASYNPDGVLKNVLELVAGNLACEAAYLTIRAGDVFRLQVVLNLPPALVGVELPVHDSELLARLVNGGRGAIEDHAADGMDPAMLVIGDGTLRSWLALPIVVGRRVVGYVAFCSTNAGAFDAAQLEHSAGLVDRLANTVENAIVFAEAARYLQRLAMLNELATAASLGVDTDEAARRVIQHLRRAFNTERVAVFLLSPDGQTLLEYGRRASRGARWIVPVAESLVGLAVETGQPMRSGDVSNAPRYRMTDPGMHSALSVPLKYRGKIIGALALESAERNAFTINDEQLLVVIASHLAGLIENVRLNEETRDHARQLQATVRQLQAVRETALDLAGDLDLDTLFRRAVHRARELVDARGAEMGLLDEQLRVVRVQVCETPWYNNVGWNIPWMAGVAGRVVAFGEPLVVDDYNAWTGRLLPERIAPFRAVAGVPLKFRGQVIGALTVLDDRPEKNFTSEDVETLELLGPQIAVSIRNARLYQELQERIEAQRLAEARLLRSARLAAVGEMAAGVAHELNNPLTTVTGFVELVLDDLEPEASARPDLELVLR